MRKNNFSLYVKRFLIMIFMSIIFIILLSTVMVGIGKGGIDLTKSIIPKFLIQENNIMFNKNNGDIRIKVYLTKENKVEEMFIEEYVRGVVAAEMPAEFSLEALKAQAVAARTFGLAHMEEFGGKKYKSNTGANVCDTVQCQVFINKEARLNSWPKSKRDEYWNKLSDAVEQTTGEVLMINGKVVLEPYYFAISSGKTENAADVFSEDMTYLKSVSSPGEEVAPKFKSVVKVSYSEFIEKVNSQYPNSGLSQLKLKNQVNIISKNESGSVKEIKVGKTTISGAKFRSIMGLNSANFSIKFNSGNIEISCIGYGHGVGMSQWGANAMGKLGKGYQEILKHYYNGVEIRKITNK